VARKKTDASADAKDIFISKTTMLFDKYSYDVEIYDPSLKNYVNLKPISYPNSFGRKSQSQSHKANLNIIERLENSLMRGGTGGKIGGRVIRTKGRLQGKKLKVMKAIMEAFEIISKQTGKNPIQVYVEALENSSPIEDTTRVRYGGIISNVAVDVSASRRLDIALRNIGMGTVTSAFHNKRTLAQSLANELMLASNNDINSYAIKRKNETERMARSAK
jgi:small subunit ribosomal protein S7